MPNDIINEFTKAEYKEGFVTDVEQEFIPKGLDEDIIRTISALKQEPDWLLVGGQRSGNLNRKADEVSAAIDRCIVNSEVEYETPFDVNDSFSVVFDAFCSERAK